MLFSKNLDTTRNDLYKAIATNQSCRINSYFDNDCGEYVNLYFITETKQIIIKYNESLDPLVNIAVSLFNQEFNLENDIEGSIEEALQHWCHVTNSSYDR